MSNFRKLLYIISWIPVIVIKLALAILGLITVPIAIATKWPKLFWLWGNDEEGCPLWWTNQASNNDHGWFVWLFPRFWWFAIRNPVNNFRYIFKDREANISGNWTEDSMEAQDLIDRRMRRAYRWNYNGPFAGYRRVWLKDYKMSHGLITEINPPTYSELWIGWKVGSTVPGMGFTMQWRRNVEIGKRLYFIM